MDGDKRAAISRGMVAAKRAGVRIGRPRGDKDAAIRRLLSEGWDVEAVRVQLMVGRTAIRRVRAEMER